MKWLVPGKVLAFDDFLDKRLFQRYSWGKFTPVSTRAESSWYVHRMKHDIQDDELDAALANLMQANMVKEAVCEFEDHAWRIVWDQAIRWHESAVSVYPPQAGMAWHTDHRVDNRVLVWHLPLNEVDGGLEITAEPLLNDVEAAKTFEPRRKYHIKHEVNRLVVFPAWMPHRALPSSQERFLLHGHFNSGGPTN